MWILRGPLFDAKLYPGEGFEPGFYPTMGPGAPHQGGGGPPAPLKGDVQPRDPINRGWPEAEGTRPGPPFWGAPEGVSALPLGGRGPPPGPRRPPLTHAEREHRGLT